MQSPRSRPLPLWRRRPMEAVSRTSRLRTRRRSALRRRTSSRPSCRKWSGRRARCKLDGGTDGRPVLRLRRERPARFPPLGSNVEATKTEPDKNTYLVFRAASRARTRATTTGRTSSSRATRPAARACITRINLDADGAHRVTLMSTQTDAGVASARRSTARPGIRSPQKLLFTTESGVSSGQPTPSIYQATPDFPSHVDDISNVIGRAGFEGVQNDDKGNLYHRRGRRRRDGVGRELAHEAAEQLHLPVRAEERVEPRGGRQGSGAPGARRRQAAEVHDASELLRGGRCSGSGYRHLRHNSAGYVALHTYGTTFATKWITINTTTSSTPLPGADDNALAKAAGATPFKRPENGVFRPGLELQRVLLRRDRRHRQPDLRRRRAAPIPTSRPARART